MHESPFLHRSGARVGGGHGRNSPAWVTTKRRGKTFVRIGVGAVRKPVEPAYRRFSTYDIVDPGTWTVHRSADRVALVHTLRDTAGYACEYRKTVRVKGNSLILENRKTGAGIRQTGDRPISKINL